MTDRNIGGIVGYLKLDKSDWDAELQAAGVKADELKTKNPNIKISTNAASAIAQLESVAVAVKGVQDAQGKLSVSQAKLNDLESTGNAAAGRLASAHEAVAKSSRDVELAQIRLAKAYTDTDVAGEKLGRDVGNLGKNAESSGLSFTQFLVPAIAGLAVVAGPALAVAAGGLGTILLGAKGLESELKGGLSDAFSQMEDEATAALAPFAPAAIRQLNGALGQLTPLFKTFGATIGQDADQLTKWLNDGGMQGFVKYADTELPIINNLFKDLSVSAVEFFKDSQSAANGLLGTTDQVVVDLTKIAALSQKGGGASAFPDFSSGPGYFNIGDVNELLGKASQYTADVGSWFRNKPSASSSVNPGSLVAAGPRLDSQAISGATAGLDPTATAQAAANIVSTISAKFPTANTAVQQLLASMQTFGQSEDTAADKAALLGAALVASQGDALSYAGAVSQGYAAVNTLVTTFQQQAADSATKAGTVNASAQSTAMDKVSAATSRLNAAQIKAGSAQKTAADAASANAAVASAQAGLATANNALNKAAQPVGGVSASIAFADTEKAAIDLNTGLINLKATGAAPLVQQLQQMQTAAEAAAEATYQHEVATKGESAALGDAQTIFESLTGGALVQNAKQLGLTTAQAQKLADQYFSFDGKTVTTTVQSIGLNDVNATLQQIGIQLSYLSGHPFAIDLSLNASTLNGQSLHDVVNSIPAAAPAHRATGGALPSGYTWTGENGPELIKWNGTSASVYNAQQSAAMGANPSGPQVIHLTSYVVMANGNVLGKTVAEYNQQVGRL